MNSSTVIILKFVLGYFTVILISKLIQPVIESAKQIGSTD